MSRHRVTLRTALLREGYGSVLRPLLFSRHGGEPEAVHEEMVERLARASRSPAQLAALRWVSGRPQHPVTVAGIRFPGRVGVAAGLDKNGLCGPAWAAMGFGFAELGTVTALPQPGNDRPRLFRLPASRAIVNRMGFNNRGAQALAGHLAASGVRRGEATFGIPLGISLGKSKVVPVEDAVGDYLAGFRLLAPYADYVAVNVSSPNTPGLRTLQDAGALSDLVRALVAEAAAQAHPLGPLPVFVKLAPDLSDAQLDEVVGVVTDAGGRGLIATNTTLERDGLAAGDKVVAAEAGGLSGEPLRRRALEVVTRICRSSELPVMGVGGIMTPADAARMLDAGAALVQVYTGFIYEGSALVSGINDLRRPA